MNRTGRLKVFAGNSNKALTLEICSYLGIPLGEAEVSNFPDGETSVQINENVRGEDVFIIQSTCPPVNQNLMELLTMIDALKRSSVRRLTAVVPYFGYARQDRKVQPRVPITAKLVSNLITVAGADRVLVLDLHVGQIQGFFDIPVDHLFAAPILIDYFKKKDLKDLVVVSPDAGGVERARAFAKRLDAQVAVIDKRRSQPGVAQVMNVVGEVEGRNTVIVDDIIDTGGTIVQSADSLLERGAQEVYASCTHPVFSGEALERLENSKIKEVVATNTISLEDRIPKRKIILLSVASLLGEAIKRIHNDDSLSSLFI